jgi:hypothetical protein
MRQNFILIGLLAMLFLGCNKENSSSNMPVIKTIGVSRVGYTVATGNVFLEDNTDTNITELGVCWNLSGLPTLADSVSTLRTPNSVPHVYSILIPQLNDNTIYYVRGYIKTTSGYIGYGETIKFKTLAKRQVTILFQQNFENYAWSDSHFGFFIDGDGNIRGYTMFPGYHQWDPMIRVTGDEYSLNNDTYFTKSDLEFNYYLTDTLLGKVDLDTLNLMKNMISGILSSLLTQGHGGCNDSGINSYFAYYYSADNQEYQRIVLERFGDVCYTITNDDAQKISNWLFTVSKQFYPYFGMHCNCGYH